MFSGKRKQHQDSFWNNKKNKTSNSKQEVKYNVYYHASALPNLESILKQGLQVNQRGKNAFRLDITEEYEDFYGSKEEAKKFEKPPCIHLGSARQGGIEYMEMLADIHKVGAVLFEIKLDASIKLAKDSESAHGLLCLTDIDPKFLRVVDKMYPAQKLAVEQESEESDKEDQDQSPAQESDNEKEPEDQEKECRSGCRAG